MLKAKEKPLYEKLFATPTTVAIASLVLSLVALSFSPILIRLSEGELGPNATIFNRFWISTVAFVIWNQFTARGQQSGSQGKLRQRYTIRQILLLIGVGFVMFATLALWAWSLAHTSVANSTLMHNLAPLFTVLGGWLIWGKRFDGKFLSGMFIAIIGACLLAYYDFAEAASEKLQGDIAAILSAVFLGLYPLLVEQLRTHLSPVVIMTWCSAIGTVLLLPVVLLTENQIFPHSLHEWFYVISLALICQILGLSLYAYSLNRLSSGFVSLCDLFVPVLSTQEAWVIFSESPGWVTLISFSVILLGVCITSTSESAIKTEAESL
jgi:drug/metabolite transporter (DMT)-like permease